MATSDTVRQFLEAQDIRFSLVKCPWDAQGRWQGGGEAISHAAVARPVILKDEKGLVMVTMPITGRLDLGAMNRQLGRHLKVVEKDEFPTVFAQCTSFILPALAALAGLECVLDGALLEQENVYIASGNGEQMIRLSTEDFERLNPGLRIGKSLLPSEASGKDHKMPANTDKVIKINGSLPLADMRQRIENTTQLPPMPSLAHKILQLNANPYAHAEDLAKLLEKDPSLTAQIVRYAQSPFFGYQSKVASVRQAMSLVLGYDMVMNIALGFAVGRPFNIPMEGPLGLRDFWRHSIYSASLSQALCDFMPRGTPFQPGMAYLTGLLHNFGLLILGHLFPKEFGLLHKAVIQEPQTPLVELEQRLLGTTHMEMGTWLMSEWNMPQEVITVQKEHHNPVYDGPGANYPQLVCLSNVLLKDYGLGDVESNEMPPGLIESLGLDMKQVNKAMERTMESAEGLEIMARQLVA